MKISLRYLLLLLVFGFALNILHAQFEINPAVIKKMEEQLGVTIVDITSKDLNRVTRFPFKADYKELTFKGGIKFNSISTTTKINNIGFGKLYEGEIITHMASNGWTTAKNAFPIIDKEDFVNALTNYSQQRIKKVFLWSPQQDGGLHFYAIKMSELNIEELKKASAGFSSSTETKQTVIADSKIINSSSPDTAMYRGSGDPLKGLNVSKAKDSIIGNYYALIIGIDKYSGVWTALNNATHDARAVEKTLREKYKMNAFYTLYDAQATRVNIMNVLENLVNTLKEDDNVIIYFSGHGEYKKTMNKGYWVPYDAKTNAVSDLISNNDIQTFLASIQTKHTLLISDACFSGDIFRGTTIAAPFEESEKYYTKVYNKNSRQALTSGGIEPVMDGGKDGHSIFTYYLLKSLNTNEKKYLDAGQLYNDIKIAVVNNSNQTPLLNPVKDTGDEGGQFIFIKK